MNTEEVPVSYFAVMFDVIAGGSHANTGTPCIWICMS